jgi:secretion/DNA translocation related CpaE-like protein
VNDVPWAPRAGGEPPAAGGCGPAPGRPLLVTADPALLDDLLRLCGAAGVEAQVAHDAGAARRAWTGPPLVVVGAELAGPLLRTGVTRRSGVVLVGSDPDDAGVWEVAAALGAESVVFLPDADPWLADRLGEAAEGPTSGGVTVAVLGGRGGAGATVLAAGLARASASSGCATMLIDGDPLGGGIDMVLGLEDAPGLRWPDLSRAVGRLSATALRDALPRSGQLTVLSCGRDETAALPVEAVGSVLRAARQSHDLVVVDLPRRLDGVTDAVLAIAIRTFLVVPAEVRATAAAARVASAVSARPVDLQVVVRGPAPSGLTGALVAGSLGLPLAGWLDSDAEVVRALSPGRAPDAAGRTPLSTLCRALLAGVRDARQPAA